MKVVLEIIIKIVLILQLVYFPPVKCCSPKSIYVGWIDLRQHINNMEGISINISSSMIGPPLSILKCRNILNPCNTIDGYCGIDEQDITIKTLPIIQSTDYESLQVMFYEDVACKCVKSKMEYDYSNDFAGKPPYIIDAVLNLKSMKTTNLHFYSSSSQL